MLARTGVDRDTNDGGGIVGRVAASGSLVIEIWGLLPKSESSSCLI